MGSNWWGGGGGGRYEYKQYPWDGRHVTRAINNDCSLNSKREKINKCQTGFVELVGGMDANEDVFPGESQPKKGGKRVAPA